LNVYKGDNITLISNKVSARYFFFSFDWKNSVSEFRFLETPFKIQKSCLKLNISYDDGKQIILLNVLSILREVIYETECLVNIAKSHIVGKDDEIQGLFEYFITVVYKLEHILNKHNM